MHRFEIRTLSLYMYSICLQCLSPRMHQTSNYRYNLNGYGSLKVTPIACGLEAQNGMVKKKTAFLSICILLILPAAIINNKDLLKTWLIFNFYEQLKKINSYCWTLISHESFLKLMLDKRILNFFSTKQPGNWHIYNLSVRAFKMMSKTRQVFM